MGWSIELMDNDLQIDASVAQKLFEAQDYRGHIWEHLEDVLHNGHLTFDHNSGEWADFLSNTSWAIKVLKKAKVQGRILWRSTEGDNAGEYWGHEFDGKGGYTELVGEEHTTWKPRKKK